MAVSREKAVCLCAPPCVPCADGCACVKARRRPLGGVSTPPSRRAYVNAGARSLAACPHLPAGLVCTFFCHTPAQRHAVLHEILSPSGVLGHAAGSTGAAAGASAKAPPRELLARVSVSGACSAGAPSLSGAAKQHVPACRDSAPTVPATGPCVGVRREC